MKRKEKKLKALVDRVRNGGEVFRKADVFVLS